VRSSKELDGNLGPQGLRPDILQALVARLKWLRKIPATGLPTLSLGDSSKIQVGDYALAIGDPFGIGETATLGIVSATGRGNPDIEDYEDFIQTDAAINPGNSEPLQSRTLNGCVTATSTLQTRVVTRAVRTNSTMAINKSE
jgi:hypothetical protein